MKISLFLLTILFSLPSCSPLNLNQILAGADTVEIIFYKTNSNQPEDTIRIKEKAEIRNLMASFASDNAPLYKCGYTGKLRFLKNRVKVLILEAEFNMHPACSHISFLSHKKLYCRKMSKSGQEFIQLARKHKRIIEQMEG